MTRVLSVRGERGSAVMLENRASVYQNSRSPDNTVLYTYPCFKFILVAYVLILNPSIVVVQGLARFCYPDTSMTSFPR